MQRLHNDAAMTTLTPARVDINRQRRHDAKRAMGFEQLETRYRAVFEAARAHMRGECGAEYAQRQALVDLASCAERMAGELPAPQRP